MRKYTQAPHPFVFEPPAESSSRVSANTATELVVILIGGSHIYLPHVFLALSQLGKKGLGRDHVPYEIEAMTSMEGDTLYDSRRGTVLHTPPPIELRIEPGTPRRSRFALEFQTPLRLQFEGDICPEPGLPALVAALRRRLFLLRYFHGGGSTEQLDTKFLDAAHDAKRIENTFGWQDAKRQSTRQHRSIPIGGVTGKIVYEGDIGVLEPLLRAGEFVHIGKNATFGLGKFRLLLGDES